MLEWGWHSWKHERISSDHSVVLIFKSSLMHYLPKNLSPLKGQYLSNMSNKNFYNGPQSSYLITTFQWSCRKIKFSQCLSFCPRGKVSTHGGVFMPVTGPFWGIDMSGTRVLPGVGKPGMYTSWMIYPQKVQLPARSYAPWKVYLLRRYILPEGSPHSALTSTAGQWSGRYASYWDAFLFIVYLLLVSIYVLPFT